MKEQQDQVLTFFKEMVEKTVNIKTKVNLKSSIIV